LQFVDRDDTVIQSSDFLYGADLSSVLLPTQVKIGYTFDGWDIALPSTMPASDVTLKAQYTAHQYTISFDSNGGSPVESITQDYMTPVIPPANPTKEGYTFVGWDGEIPETIPAHSINLQAIWSINDYHIMFFDLNNTLLMTSDHEYGSDISNINKPNTDLIGYEFFGWFIDEERTIPFEDVTMPNQHMNLYGKWISEVPVLYGVQKEWTYYIGAGTFDPLNDVTAFDLHDGDITDTIELIGIYLLNTPGTYNLVIRATNSKSITVQESIQLVVLANGVPQTLTTNPITITLWHAMGEANRTLLQKYANSFKLLYPNVNIVIPSGFGNYDTLKNNMINAIISDTMPNMVQSYPDHVAEYLNGNAVLSLNPYIYSAAWGLNGPDALSDIIQSYLQENSQYNAAGTYYSLPFNKSTEVMIYNKTAFDALDLEEPKTWQDIIAAAPALKAYGDAIAEAKVRAANPSMSEYQLTPLIAAAKALIVPAAYDSPSNAFITFTRQFGGAYTSINFSTFQGQYLWRNNPNTTAAMQFLKDNKQVITLPEFWDQQYASTPFVNQQTFVTIGSSAGVRYNVPATNPSTGSPLFDIAVGPVPYNELQPNNKAAIQQGTNIALLNTGTDQEKLASWLFLKHIINTENTTDWAINTGYLPVRTSAYNSALYQSFLNSPTTTQVYLSMAANAAFKQSGYMFYEPAFIGSSRARVQVGIALERIMFGDGNIAAALQQAYDETYLGG
jgi:ABC-type glycerol-3-phosphate transport system substrate-binding protein